MNKYIRKQQGINLLDFDMTEDLEFGPSGDDTFFEAGDIDAQTRRAVIVEKSQGVSNKMIALRFDMSPATVSKIWKDFINSTVDVRRLGDENPEVFIKKIRRKAVNAIENGLDCDRDPYKQGNLGVKVMAGIGEFKDVSETNNLHVLVAAVPDEWKQRYIGPRVTGTGRVIDVNSVKDVSNGVSKDIIKED